MAFKILFYSDRDIRRLVYMINLDALRSSSLSGDSDLTRSAKTDTQYDYYGKGS